MHNIKNSKRESYKLDKEVSSINNKVNTLSNELAGLRRQFRYSAFKDRELKVEILNLSQKVHSLHGRMNKLNHEILNPNNEVQKLFDKSNSINKTADILNDAAKNLRDALRSKLQTTNNNS